MTEKTSDTERQTCHVTHNPGEWPYISRCALTEGHEGDHIDRHGRTWSGDNDVL